MFSSNTSQVSNDVNYIEDVFSTYLYTGNGSTQTITNGIDLAGEGGMVWTKRRATTQNHLLFDTARGVGNRLNSNTTNANEFSNFTLTSFNNNGFSLGLGGDTNANNSTFASWTFRKAEKFFDVVTWTGNDVAGRQIPHNLGSTPGCVIVKCTSDAGQWSVWNRGASTTAGYLQATDAFTTGSFAASFNSTAPTSTVFTVANGNVTNGNGKTYVAYLFAHDAGGFGASGSDNVISCGSFTHNGTSTTVNLGYEPQWFIIKRTDAAAEWELTDTMRSASATGIFTYLYPSASFAETTNLRGNITATGLSLNSGLSAGTYIYIAIRRGPMKTPTTGTSVFDPDTYTGDNATSRLISSGFATDFAYIRDRNDGTEAYRQNYVQDRLRGGGRSLVTNSTGAEGADTGWTNPDMENEFQSNSGILVTPYSSRYNASSKSYVSYQFRRAPGFFDEVCYTGDGSNPKTITHNLAAVPELMIVKRRNNTGSWLVYSAGIGATNYLVLNATDASTAGGVFNNATPTSSSFQVYGTSLNTNGGTYVAYLFATVPGVSKVGSYTGTGTTQQINCGFTGGARFVLIKRTDSTGDWYVWDSARGIVAGNDPYLLLNSTAAEVTNTDYVDTYSAGFEISSTAPAAINASGGTFIFFAVA